MLKKKGYNCLLRYVEDFFIVPWILMVINTCFFYSNISQFCPPLLGEISLLLFLVKIVLSFNWSLKEIILNILLLLIGGISYFISKEKRILWLMVVLMASKDIKVNKMIPITAITYSFMCLLFIICFVLGLSEQGTNLKGGVSFGLNHPNVCHNYFLIISSLFTYIYYKKIKTTHLAVMIGLNCLLYCFTLSRSGAITFIIAYGYLIFVKMCKNSNTIKKTNIIFLSILFMGGVIITILPIIYQKNTILEFINQISTGRIEQANVYYKSFGIHPFGSFLDILHEDKPKWYLDIGYTKILINNGIVPYIFIFGFYILITIRFCRKSQTKKIFLVVTVLVSMYFENMCTYIFMNVSMLWFAEQILYNDILSRNLKRSLAKTRKGVTHGREKYSKG